MRLHLGLEQEDARAADEALRRVAAAQHLVGSDAHCYRVLGARELHQQVRERQPQPCRSASAYVSIRQRMRASFISRSASVSVSPALQRQCLYLFCTGKASKVSKVSKVRTEFPRLLAHGLLEVLDRALEVVRADKCLPYLTR
jgi:hypothetical protein